MEESRLFYAETPESVMEWTPCAFRSGRHAPDLPTEPSIGETPGSMKDTTGHPNFLDS